MVPVEDGQDIGRIRRQFSLLLRESDFQQRPVIFIEESGGMLWITLNLLADRDLTIHRWERQGGF